MLITPSLASKPGLFKTCNRGEIHKLEHNSKQYPTTTSCFSFHVVQPLIVVLLIFLYSFPVGSEKMKKWVKMQLNKFNAEEKRGN